MPIEFPLYQWIVAALVRVSGLPIEPAGRWVSAGFFLASSGTRVASSCAPCGCRRASCLLCLAILLASPFYLFWSRTFMIESTALFLSLAYLAAVMRWRERPAVAAVALAAVSAASRRW